MTRYIKGAVFVIGLILAILAGDAFLPRIGMPTISETVVFWTNVSPLIPALLGFGFGLLVMHLFERYFIRDPEVHWFDREKFPVPDEAVVLYCDGMFIRDPRLSSMAPFVAKYWTYTPKMPQEQHSYGG